MKLSKSDRQQQILLEFRSSPATRLGELAELLSVSKETVRRDITEMSKKGLLSRTYGGAVASFMNYEPQMRERMRINTSGRRRMADVAAGLAGDARVVMIDPGSTMVHVAERLALAVPRRDRPALTVVTNSLRNANILAENPGIRIIAAPGEYDESEAGLFGELTLEFIARFRADILFTGASGIGAGGVTDANSAAAAVKRAMIRQAARVVLVVDAAKFDHIQFDTVCPLAALDDLVTDEAPPSALADALFAAGVDVHVA